MSKMLRFTLKIIQDISDIIPSIIILFHKSKNYYTYIYIFKLNKKTKKKILDS